MKTFPLLELPEELVSLVAFHLTTPSDRLHFMLASKQISRIATEYLYREVRLIAHSNSPNRAWLKDLTIRLLVRPDLAALVEDLVIRLDWVNMGEPLVSAPSEEVGELHPALKTAIAQFAEDIQCDKSELKESVDSEDVLIALLIHALPNLKSLDFDVPELPSYLNSFFSRSRNIRRWPALQKLNEVLLVIHPRVTLHDPDEYMPFFHLSGLRRISILGIYRPDDRSLYNGPCTIASNLNNIKVTGEMRSARPGSLSSVEYLEIRGSTLPFPLLCSLISICRELHTFAYEHQGQPYMSFTSIIQALRWHAETLRNLSLTYLCGQFIEYVENCNEGLDFSQLHNLDHIKTTVAGLLGTEAPFRKKRRGRTIHVEPQLPTSIRKITFVDDGIDDYERHHFIKALQQLIVTKDLSCPRLAKISTLASDQAAAELLETELRKVASDQDVELRIFRSGDRFVERGWGMDENLCWYETYGMHNVTLERYQDEPVETATTAGSLKRFC